MISNKIKACRICKSTKLENILDLGIQPLANSLKDAEDIKEDKIPLIITRCDNCGTIQLTEDASPDVMFSDYVWVTGTSSTAKEYSKIFCERLLKKKNGEGLQIMEIASNDGTFLREFKKKSHKVIGIDPAKNIAKIANNEGIYTIPSFFNSKTADELLKSEGPTDIIIARNVIPHVPNPNDVIDGISRCLKQDGIGVVEFHWSEKIMTEIHYDSIYHEHYFYHSIESIRRLLESHMMYPFDVDISPISGGSLVVYFAKNRRDRSDRLKRLIAHEKSIGLNSKERWKEFAKKTKIHSEELVCMIRNEKSKGKKVIGYGASARSSTMLNYCDINNTMMDLIADKSELKHGKFTAGTNIKIVSPDEALTTMPDVIVLLAWNFADEIIKELKERGYKGKIIKPLPLKPTIMEI